MNKNFIVLIVVAVFFVLGFSSCQKEGVYKPKEKIASIYRADTNTKKYLSEKWTWDGKKLATIEHFYVNYIGELTLNYTEYFKYDSKNRIERIELDANYYMQYTYNGNKLDKIEIYDNNMIEQSAKVHYDGKKIDKIEFYIYYYESNKNTTRKLSLLPRHLLDKIMPNIKKSMSQKSTTMDIITLELTWDGDNLSKSKMYYSYTSEDYEYDENTGEYVPNTYDFYEEVLISYSYDDKMNPRYGLRNMDFMYAYDGDIEESVNYFSKNNIVSATYFYKEKIVPVNGGTTREYSDTVIANNIITYDGKNAIEIITTVPGSDYTVTTFYEFE